MICILLIIKSLIKFIKLVNIMIIVPLRQGWNILDILVTKVSLVRCSRIKYSDNRCSGDFVQFIKHLYFIKSK